MLFTNRVARLCASRSVLGEGEDEDRRLGAEAEGVASLRGATCLSEGLLPLLSIARGEGKSDETHRRLGSV
jgi:hypothetical protein